MTIPLAGHSAVIRRFPASGADNWSIVALHGFTGSTEDFLPLREAMGVDRFHWICPDFMGHGSSDSPSNVDPYLLQWTLQLVDQARRLAPVPVKTLLLGYSMGGRIALHYLRRARSLATIVLGASPGLSDPQERLARQSHDREWIRPGKTHIGEFCDRWEAQPLIQPQTRLPEPLNSALAGRRRSNTVCGLFHSLLACGTGTLPGLWDSLEEMPPVLCMSGQEDVKFTEIARRMHARNPKFLPVVIPGSGHAPHLENPAAVASVINGFLTGPGAG